MNDILIIFINVNLKYFISLISKVFVLNTILLTIEANKIKRKVFLYSLIFLSFFITRKKIMMNICFSHNAFIIRIYYILLISCSTYYLYYSVNKTVIHQNCNFDKKLSKNCSNFNFHNYKYFTQIFYK